MKVVISNNIGFCFGVKVAFDNVKKALKKKKYQHIYLEHDLVHNEKVMKQLFCNHKYEIYNGQKLTKNDLYIISAHGHDFKKTIPSDVVTLDATCPFLIQRMLFLKQKSEEYKIIILGEEKHAETISLLSYTKEELNIDSIYISSLDELEKYVNLNEKFLIITQSTFNLSEKDRKILKTLNPQNVIIIGACPSYYERMKQACNQYYPTSIIIGSKTSSNTRSIYENCKKVNENTYLISSLDELEFIKDKLIEPIYITSGTSTPDGLVKSVIGNIKNLKRKKATKE